MYTNNDIFRIRVLNNLSHVEITRQFPDVVDLIVRISGAIQIILLLFNIISGTYN